MKYIEEILSLNNSSFDNLIRCLEIVKENGDVCVVKLDGGRMDNQYTVFISFSNNKREMIRVDGSDLKEVLIDVLRLYIIE